MKKSMRNPKRKIQMIEEKFYRTTKKPKQDENPFWPEELKAWELTEDEKRKLFEEKENED